MPAFCLFCKRFATLLFICMFFLAQQAVARLRVCFSSISTRLQQHGLQLANRCAHEAGDERCNQWATAAAGDARYRSQRPPRAWTSNAAHLRRSSLMQREPVTGQACSPACSRRQLESPMRREAAAQRALNPLRRHAVRLGREPSSEPALILSNQEGLLMADRPLPSVCRV